MNITQEAIEVLYQRIKDLAVDSTPDQLAYLAKSLEAIVDKNAISDIVQMTEVKEIIDALQKRLKDLAANSTPDQLAYLAKSLESIVDKSAVSEIVQMADGKLGELLSAARSHLNEINSNKENSIAAITEAKTESIGEINTLKTNSLAALRASSDSHTSLLDTRKDANIAAINSVSEGHKDDLKGLMRAANKAPDISSITGEIETRNEQLKNTFEIISDPEILSKTINENDLETWLDNSDNQEKFKRMLSNANAVLNITYEFDDDLRGFSPALSKLIKSPKALNLLLKSNFAANIIAKAIAVHTLQGPRGVITSILLDRKVLSILTTSLPAMNMMMASLPVIKTMDHSVTSQVITKSKTTINAIISSGVVLNAVIKSEFICKEIETIIQNQRQEIVDCLEYSPWLFRKQTGVTVGDGTNTKENGRGSATIYVPTSCTDNNNTDFKVNSLLTGNQLVHITKHRGITYISSGIALRGVQVIGTGGSSGNVTFDVYTTV